VHLEPDGSMSEREHAEKRMDAIANGREVERNKKEGNGICLTVNVSMLV
jgi:hypothetical protein